MGTDDYQIKQANAGSTSAPGEEATSSYSLDLTDSVSSSWHDNGADVLTSSDLLSGETDTYTWNHLNSVTDTYWDSDSFSEAGTISGGTWVTANYQNPTGNGAELFSSADSGCETLSDGGVGDGVLTTTAETNCFTYQSSSFESAARPESFSTSLASNITSYFASEAGTNTFSWFETGSDSLSGSMSAASDSYFVNTDADANWSIDQFVNDEPTSTYEGEQFNVNYSEQASGTESANSGEVEHGTINLNSDVYSSESYSGSGVLSFYGSLSFNALGIESLSETYAASTSNGDRYRCTA